MLNRASVIAVMAFIVCFTGTPAWALSFCPVVRHTVQHPCCPTRSSAPAPLCLAHCSTTAFGPVRPHNISADLAVVHAPVLNPPLAVVAEPVVTRAVFDSGGLWLRDRVLRI